LKDHYNKNVSQSLAAHGAQHADGSPGVLTPSKRKETLMKFNRNIGFLLLAIWLILTGLSAFVSMGGLGVILALLAIAAGIFILMNR
jgi:hypothetical protein